jgi:hypothetical protein
MIFGRPASALILLMSLIKDLIWELRSVVHTRSLMHFLCSFLRSRFSAKDSILPLYSTWTENKLAIFLCRAIGSKPISTQYGTYKIYRLLCQSYKVSNTVNLTKDFYFKLSLSYWSYIVLEDRTGSCLVNCLFFLLSTELTMRKELPD